MSVLNEKSLDNVRAWLQAYPSSTITDLLDTIAAKDREIASIGEVLERLKARADNYYCDYIAKCSTADCLGEEIKLRKGEFTQANLNAHREGSQLFGKHSGVMEALKEFRSALRGETEGER